MPGGRITKIKTIREAKGLKAVYVAECISVSKARYSDIERGIGYPKPWQLKAIASVLNVPMEELVEVPNDRPMPSTPEK